jgi:hypothetical protein
MPDLCSVSYDRKIRNKIITVYNFCHESKKFNVRCDPGPSSGLFLTVPEKCKIYECHILHMLHVLLMLNPAN